MTDKEMRIEVIKSSFDNMHNVIVINCRDVKETSLAIEKLKEAKNLIIKGIEKEEM